MRNFEIRYFLGGCRHTEAPVTIYRKQADTVIDAFKRLPLGVQRDVLQLWDSDNPFEQYEAEAREMGYCIDDANFCEQLDSIDSGGDSFLHVLEKTDSGLVHVCGIDGTYQEEGADQEW